MINIGEKECKWCGEEKSLNEFYSQNKRKKDGTEYIYYHPECKECTSKRATQWRKANPEKNAKAHKKYRQTSKNYRKYVKNLYEYQKESGYSKKWRKENKDKLNLYQQERRMHKEHDISKDDLDELNKYTNSSCMYCGMTEKESLEVYGQHLHKDHAINDGSNGIDNCILACKGCNVSKYNRDWNEWYTPDNPRYSEDRYLLIKTWLEIFI